MPHAILNQHSSSPRDGADVWSATSIGELIDAGILFIKNGYPQGGHNSEGEGVPHLRPFNVTDAGRIDLTQIKWVPAPPADSPYWLRPNDVLFNNTNSEEKVGKTAHFDLDGDYVLSNHMTILRALRQGIVDPYWLSKALLGKWFGGEFQAMCRRHVNQASVSLQRIKDVCLDMPPFAEQRAIAHVLRTVQRAKEATEKVIAATRQLKQSLMRHLFTYGPVPFDQADKVKLKETEIGGLPEHWRARPLKEFIGEGPQNGIYKPSSLYGSGTPIVRIDDFGNEGDTVEGAPNRVRLSRDEIVKYRLEPDDILVNRVNSLSHLGKVALIGALSEPTAFESNMMRLSVDPDSADTEYVFRYLASPFCRIQLTSRARRAVAQSSINQTDVKSVLVPEPPRPEQRTICASLDAMDAKREAEERRLASLDALFQSLLHHLMTGKIRVNNIKLPKEMAD